LDRLEADRGERLVDLDQVEVGDGEALLGQRVPDGVARLRVERVVRTGDVAVRTDLGDPAKPQLLGLGPAGDHDRAGPVGDRRGAARGDRAVAAERRAQLRQGLHGGVGPYALVLADHQRVAAALRDPYRNDLLGEDAVLLRGGGPLVAARGERVLLLTGD